MLKTPFAALAIALAAFGLAYAQDKPAAEPDFAAWPVLKSTFPSTGGNGIMIKGYDPVITGIKCATTFMAVSSDTPPAVYPAFIEFEARATNGGTLCENGKWKMMDGSNSGTTPYRLFFKDGVFRGQ
jgi:hypothetical protein